MNKTIRICYVGNQYTDFANSSDEDYAKIMGILNSNEKSFVLNNQWINKENILTVIQFEVKENANEIKDNAIDIFEDVGQESYSRPSPCC